MTTTELVNGEIRSRLARKQLTQQALAEALRLSGASVTRRMSGETPWSLPELEDVAAYLGCGLSDLLDAEVAAS